MTKQFEEMTIKQLKDLFEQWKKINPELQTAEEMLNDLNEEEK